VSAGEWILVALVLVAIFVVSMAVTSFFYR
jgi:hypothetical protein